MAFSMEFNGGAPVPSLEACTPLGHLVGHTFTVQLGAPVAGVTYRPPGQPAKVATSVDVLSGGRATVGIGAARYDRGHAYMGEPATEGDLDACMRRIAHFTEQGGLGEVRCGSAVP